MGRYGDPSYFDTTGVRLGAAPTGIQPKDLLYPEWGGIVYVPGWPSPVRSRLAFAPDCWKATLVPALLRQPYQDPVSYAAAPAAPRAKPRTGVKNGIRPFGNDTNEYQLAKAPRATYNGLPPTQRVLPVISRISLGIPAGADTQQ